ncbi:MAG: hypothetical protein JNK23_10630 [Opitutaceae bacterium]|nr:hypothetical protein [Opitutaceae bacterium]
MTTLDIFSAVKDALGAIPLDAAGDPAGEKLFEAVELFPNKQLGRALSSLLITKKRACLVVPMGVRRIVRDQGGALSVTGRRFAEVALIYTDQAYFKFEQVVAFGSDRNLGLFAFDEKIEEALTGKEISPFGGIVLGDSDPLLLSDSEQKDAPGRQAWLIQAIVPTGLIAASVE